jgi:hypothetical protein
MTQLVEDYLLVVTVTASIDQARRTADIAAILSDHSTIFTYRALSFIFSTPRLPAEPVTFATPIDESGSLKLSDQFSDFGRHVPHHSIGVQNSTPSAFSRSTCRSRCIGDIGANLVGVVGSFRPGVARRPRKDVLKRMHKET